MYESLKEIAKIIEDAKKTVKEKSQEALKASFKELFDAHPTILGLRWTQYTPYFNDGEPCRFSVNEPYAKFVDTAEDAGDYGDGFDIIPWRKEDQSDATRAIDDLFGLIAQDVMLESFGDHAKITATRDGFEVDEYSHD